MNQFQYPVPELLIPAGDEECLHAAVAYGADAVYLGSTCFGMRSAPKNFDFDQLKSACDYAHQNGVKVYLTCNTLPRNDEFSRLAAFTEATAAAGIDAYIVTDIGVLSFIKKTQPQIDIHISTQAGITNYAAANAFYELGAKRIVLARELSLTEIAEIRTRIPDDLEIECFVHGAMCVSFSGRCLLSNYLTGRDSNRGDCAQPCRWKYALCEETRPGKYLPVCEDEQGTYIMNSKDMCMIEHIPELYAAGISSFKVEGRAKASYYAAVTAHAYRAAIDGFVASGFDTAYRPEQWIPDELRKISYRDYCTGFFFGDPKDDANISFKGGYNREWNVVAVAEDYRDGYLYAEQRNRFFEGDTVEIMEKGKKPFTVTVQGLENEAGVRITAAPHPTMKLRFRCSVSVEKGAYIRVYNDVKGE